MIVITPPHPRIDYHTYLLSDAWQDVKTRYHRSSRSTCCFVCDKPWQDGFHFHHRTYARLGHEQLDDIVPACPPCHRFIHKLAAVTGWDLWHATSAARDLTAEWGGKRKRNYILAKLIRQAG